MVSWVTLKDFFLFRFFKIKWSKIMWERAAPRLCCLVLSPLSISLSLSLSLALPLLGKTAFPSFSTYSLWWWVCFYQSIYPNNFALLCFSFFISFSLSPSLFLRRLLFLSLFLVLVFSLILPETIWAPSGENATLHTGAECPDNVC